jgi:hypothetical protein
MLLIGRRQAVALSAAWAAGAEYVEWWTDRDRCTSPRNERCDCERQFVRAIAIAVCKATTNALSQGQDICRVTRLPDTIAALRQATGDPFFGGV